MSNVTWTCNFETIEGEDDFLYVFLFDVNSNFFLDDSNQTVAKHQIQFIWVLIHVLLSPAFIYSPVYGKLRLHVVTIITQSMQIIKLRIYVCIFHNNYIHNFNIIML